MPRTKKRGVNEEERLRPLLYSPGAEKQSTKATGVQNCYTGQMKALPRSIPNQNVTLLQREQMM